MINTYKVSISVGSAQVIFQASSPIAESRTANYQGHGILHLPTDIFAYQNTSGRHFSVTGKLVSRNADEAAANALNVDLIRSWILPDFGKSGATPPIVKLSGFNNNNINNVQCIIKSYSITYPDDVDWIFNNTDVPMPVICSLSVELEEAYTPQQIVKGKWNIKKSKGGSFVEGNLFDDNTSAGGGNHSVFTTPSIIDLSNSSNFTGIATNDISGFKATNQPTPFGNGNLSSTYGVYSSPLISQPQNTTSPFKDGYNPDNVDQLTFTDQRTQPASTPQIYSPVKIFSNSVPKSAT